MIEKITNEKYSFYHKIYKCERFSKLEKNILKKFNYELVTIVYYTFDITITHNATKYHYFEFSKREDDWILVYESLDGSSNFFRIDKFDLEDFLEKYFDKWRFKI